MIMEKAYAELLRAAADAVMDDLGDGSWTEDLPWGAARALAAWLRAEADDAEQVAEHNQRAADRAAATGGGTYVVPGPQLAHAVAFAHTILGDTP